MKKWRALLALAVVVLAVGLILYSSVWQAPPVRFPDGSLVELRLLKFGPAVEFTHGKTLERLLGNWIPSNGMRIAGLSLQHPTKVKFDYSTVPSLTAQFKISGPVVDGGRSQVVSPKFYRQFRLLILGEDNFPYVEEFERSKKYPDGVYVYINTTAFPRGSRVLRFRVEEHTNSLGPWRTVAEFSRRNPARDEGRKWTSETYPITRTSNGISFVLGEVTVEKRFSNAWENFWQNTVTLPVQISRDGVLLTNWGLHHSLAEDTSGNFRYFGAQKSVQNGWSTYRAFRSADPAKTWRLQTALSPDSDYAATNMFTLHVPFPLVAGFTTNVGGYPLKIQIADMLTIELLTNAPHLRLAFVSAKDNEGKDLDGRSGSWGQFKFNRMLELPFSMSQTPRPANTKMITTIAISQNVPLEFTIKPKLIDD